MNDFAWTPNRLHYNNFHELQQAAMVLQENWVGELVMAKADFKSAFKTVPPHESQAWLSWALVYNPVAHKLQATRLNTQTFGSVGAVVAWHRTASAIQAILESLGLVIFVCWRSLVITFSQQL